MQEKHILLRKQNKFNSLNYECLRPTYVWDRMAAFVVDLIVLMLIGNLITAPLKKELEKSILLQNDGAVFLKIAFIAIVYASLFLIYHTLSVYFFSKTVGKKIFRIEVRSLWHDSKNSFYSSLLRALLQLAAILLGFVPFLALFYDKKRRVFHEKVTETYTHSDHHYSTEPQKNEIRWVRVVYSIIVFYFGSWGFIEFQNFKKQYSNLSEYITHPEYLCEDVTIAYDQWIEDEETRLDVALALFNANQIDEDCLAQEAQRALAFEEEQDKAYFAMGLLHQDFSDYSIKYEEKICSFDNSGEPCLLIQILNGLKAENYDLAHQMFSKWPLKMSVYTSVIAIRQFYLERKLNLVSEKINELWGLAPLKNFLSMYRTLVHYDNEKLDKAEEAFAMSYPDLDFEHKKILSALVCQKEIQKSCQFDNSKSCQKLEENIVESDLGEVSDLEFVSYLKYSKCPNTDSEQIVHVLSSKVDNPEQVALIAAVRAESAGRYDVEKEFLDQILQTQDLQSEIYLEAQLMKLKRTYDMASINENIKQWESLGVYHPHYLSYGLGIFHQLLSLKKVDVAMQVVEFLDLNYKDYPEVRTAFLKMNELKKNFHDINNKNSEIRLPASNRNEEK